MAKTNGYKIDFTKNTVIMNYTFAKKANEYGSTEYELLKNIRADFPEIAVVVQKGREQKKANKNKRLTYDNMKSYIETFANAEELLEAFEGVKKLSVAQKSPYKFVSDWFKNQFQNYNEMPQYKDGQLVTDTPKENPQKIVAKKAIMRVA